MPSDRPQPFDGDDPGRSARQFLRDVELQCSDDAKDKQIIRRFGLLLKADSTADVWYENWKTANPGDKDDWTKVSEAFEKKFGRSEKKVFKRPEAMNILISMIDDIDACKLGSYDQSSQMDYHVLQLDKIVSEALKMGCADDMAEEVKDHLPKTLREMLEKQGMIEKWEELRTAGKKVQAYKLKKVMEEEKEKERKKEDEEARIRQLDAATRRMDATLRDFQRGRSTVSASPTAALRQGLQSIPLGRPASQQYIQPDRNNPFLTSDQPRSGNLFAPPPRRALPGHVRLQALRQNTANLVQHKPDDAGLAAYRIQVDEWQRRNPNTRNPDETRPYPLKPGTAELGSGECFRCGQLNHRQNDCQNVPLDERETSWRRTASFIIRNGSSAASSANPTPLNAVMFTQYPYLDNSFDYRDHSTNNVPYDGEFPHQGNF
ncbi:hypothetical protein QCA50_014815 [Cerrena zonata]|uniref:CCHC-type domain-containing protein n=1 Tax=Cerrena zonata TaxID=2478898 RepID=A0AAW0FMH3_9APHY